ncbi:hypothetical protein NVP1287O_66 [Vibrio phage 1.287.O._10N.286.55.C7]|nr:hypothetical protein NVP1287O_66 [Vibrio phage 1.287.O._10N.286.55.C7]
MDERFERLIVDNPNLCSTVLSKLTGVSRRTIDRKRCKSNWRYKGFGIPFLCFVNSKESAFYEVRCKRRYIYRGEIETAMVQVDRVIYCMENNGGELPPTNVKV